MPIRLTALVLVAVTAACASHTQTATPSPTSPESARQSLLRADMTAGSSARGTTADIVARSMADDGLLIAPRRGYVRSRDSVRAYLERDSLFRGTTITWQPIAAEVSSDGTHGYTFGYAELTPAAPGKYLAYWRRDARGEWRMLALKLMRRPPGSVSLAVVEQSSVSTASLAPLSVAAAYSGVMQLDRAFSALAQRDAGEAFRAHAAPTAMTTGSNAGFALGRDQVVTEFSAYQPGTLKWRPAFGAAAPSGDLVFVTGTVEISEKQPDGEMKVQATAQYMTIWRRQPDGSWKFVADA